MNDFEEIIGEGYVIRVFGNHAEGTLKIPKEKATLDGSPCCVISHNAERFISKIMFSVDQGPLSGKMFDAKSTMFLSMVLHNHNPLKKDMNLTFFADGSDAKKSIIELIQKAKSEFEIAGYP